MSFNLVKCDFCGDCLEKCQYIDLGKEEGKEEIKKLLEGEKSIVTKRCITCGSCNWYCEKGANPFDLILRRQEETGDFTTDTSVGFMDAGANMSSEVIEGEEDRPVMTTCTVGDMIPNLFEGKLFDGMTILKGGDYFCYLGYIHAGKESPFEEGIPKAIENLAKTGADEIIFFHDDCYATFTTQAVKYGLEIPFKPVHLVEYLLDYFQENQNQIDELDMKIAHQQSCAWRLFPSMAKPLNKKLDKLYELMGVERVDRKHDKVNALCCGTPVLDKDKNRFQEIQDRNIKDAKDADAEAMVFTCPICALSLREEAKENGLEPYMLSNLCRLALDEELPSGGAGLDTPNILKKVMG